MRSATNPLSSSANCARSEELTFPIITNSHNIIHLSLGNRSCALQCCNCWNPTNLELDHMKGSKNSVELIDKVDHDERSTNASVTRADGGSTGKDTPFPGDDSYSSAVAAARSNIRSIADNFVPSPPPRLSLTSWRMQLGWALRTGLAATIGMVLSISLTENDVWAGQVLIPVVAIAVIEPTVGATLKASVEAFCGSLYGSIAIVIAVALTNGVVPASKSGLRDPILFVFFVLLTLLFTSRQNFALKEKKLANAVLILGAYLAMNDGWESEENTAPGWLLPLYVLLSVGVGCLCACLVSITPLPGVSKSFNPMQSFALFEAIARLDFSVNAVKTLLETHISLVIRAEPEELKQAEVVTLFPHLPLFLSNNSLIYLDFKSGPCKPFGKSS